MGCTSSKLDDLPAVALCRERCTFLHEAIQQRYAFAEAHLAYTQSLKTVGISLHRFFHQDLDADGDADASPVLALPKERKVSGLKEVEVQQKQHVRSNSDSHIQFRSDDDDGSSLHCSGGNSSPSHRYNIGSSDYVGYGVVHETPSTFLHMKKHVTPSSVSYEQRPPVSHESVSSGQSSDYPSVYSNNYGFSNYGGGYFGGDSAPPPRQESVPTSKPPPPMPPPESSSPWDMFNPFEYDRYYTGYAPSGTSKEVREEEGTPDLEDDDYRHEVVKEVYVDHKFVDSRSAGGIYLKPLGNGEDRDVHSRHYDPYKAKPSVSVEDERRAYDVHMIDKKVVDGDKSERQKVGTYKGQSGSPGVLEIVTEIQDLFERASESGYELATILEVGKHQYKRKHDAYQAVSSRLLDVITPSLSAMSSPLSSRADTESSSASMADSSLSGFEEETGIKLKNLSSVLQKLYLWEKKLYSEVKAEEKMRVMHDRKSEKLKRLDQKGAEAHKVDSIRALIQSLSTKIKIAIQVVDKISLTINKIRDEELFPLLNELLRGLTRMWKSMLECHQSQCVAIKKARSLDAIASQKKPGDAQLEATMQLEHELIGLTLGFSSWVAAQKGCIKALNNWLLKCLLYEPEETPDGIAPFSPGRIGAPPVFILCYQWAQAMETISEKEVLDSMRLFANTVLQFWERDKLTLRRDMLENKDLERKVKNLDREDHKIQKQILALEKKMITVSGDGDTQSVYQSDTSINSLQAGLQQIFEAMERFTSSSTKAYEEILHRSEEDMLFHENVTASYDWKQSYP